MADDTTTNQGDAAVEETPKAKVTVEDSGPARKLLTIEVSEEQIKAKIEQNFGSLRDDAAVPGFRRGRAPQRLLEKRFGAAVRDDARGQLISEAYSQAIEENELDVLGEPDIKDMESIELPESGSMEFKIEVEVTPDFELPAFDSIEVKKQVAEVTDEDVTKELDEYRERMGQMKAVTDAEIAEGDFVEADVRILAGEDAGDDAEEIMHEEKAYILVHGEAREFKGHVVGIVVGDMGKRLIGQKPGHVERISMTGPQAHENEKIKEQPITIVIDTKEVQRVELAPLEQVQQAIGVESEEEMNERIKTMLEGRNEREQTSDMHEQVQNALLEKVEFELPEGITGRQTERLLSRRRMELAYRGMSEQEIEEQIAEMRGESADEAIKQLKQFFIIDRAAKQLEIDVTPEELNSRIAMMAYQQGRRPEKLRQEMQQQGQLEQLFMSIREGKTLDKIIEQAKVTEVPAEAKDD